MSDAKKRKFHTPEFKAKVGQEAMRGVKTINEIGELKVELDWLKKSPGSAGDDPANLDRDREYGVGGPAMCSGGRLPIDDLRAAKAQTGR